MVATMMSSARLMDSLLMNEATDTNVHTMMAGIKLVRDKSPVVDLKDDKELLPSSLILMGDEASVLPSLSEALLFKSCSSSLTLPALLRMAMLLIHQNKFATVHAMQLSVLQFRPCSIYCTIATKREDKINEARSRASLHGRQITNQSERN